MEGSGTSRLLAAEGMNHGHERCSTGTIDCDIVALYGDMWEQQCNAQTCRITLLCT